MKIAISGAGIAGPTLAYWLQRTGHELTLIEKAPRFRTGGYVIDFWGLGFQIAERMGILPEVLSAGYKVKELRLVDDRNRRVGGFSTDVFRRALNDRFTSLPRGDLALAIYRTIEERVETIFGDSIAAVEEHDAGVRVRLEQGGEREFDLLIGADGLHSNVRELVFGPEQQFEKRLGYGVAAIELAGYRPRDELVYIGHTRPGRQIARFTLRGDRTMVLFVFADSLSKNTFPRDVDAQKALLHNIFGSDDWECPDILSAMDAADTMYFDSVSQIKMNTWSKGRVMLIGDAAACVSLLAGEGTGLGMTQAYVLAGELKRAGGEYRTAFQNHEQRLRSFLESKQKSAAGFASFFAPKTALRVWMRNQLSKVLGLPWIGATLMAGSVRDKLELPDYGMHEKSG